MIPRRRPAFPPHCLAPTNSASAQVIAIPSEGSCSYSLTAVHHGFEQRRQGAGWWILESNGFLENEMLSQIEAKLVQPQQKAGLL